MRFLPVETRIPLKFGPETTHGVTCARVCVTVAGGCGAPVAGWGETPLSVAWLWPSDTPPSQRDERLRDFCRLIARALAGFPECGHPMEISRIFITDILPDLLTESNRRHPDDPIPLLAALACFSPFDIALHDAYAKRACVFVYDIYGPAFMNHDLSWYYRDDHGQEFRDKYPDDFLIRRPRKTLRAWHLVGGHDLLGEEELTGDEPNDGYPVVLTDWITRDGLTALKIKLFGKDPDWDYQRLVRVGEIAAAMKVEWLCADFNCCVEDPRQIVDALTRLSVEKPVLYKMLAYVEQPFPRDLHANPLDVRAVASLKPLFMDESAHDWEHVEFGRTLGWTGVALKTCKTQTGALLSLCWARMKGMDIMVQDLTNPMLAQIPHVLLAAYAGSGMGVETNAMQFYPAASLPEAAVHPGLYSRRSGQVDFSALGKIGFGYHLEKIRRELPPAEKY